MEDRGIEQDLIPYVWQLDLANVLTEVWTTDPDVHCLLDVLHLPMNYSKVVHTDVMICGVGIVTEGGWGIEMFPEPFPKGP